VEKKLVLNACGVKSLGGVKLFVEAFEIIVESRTEIIVLYSEDEFFTELKYYSDDNRNIKFIKMTNKRYLHPYLHLILNKNQKKIINESNAIIHFGNFGFKTDIKSFVLIQNILPFVKSDIKNLILKYYISKSMESSDYVIVQLSHVTKFFKNKYKSKILEIGNIEEHIVEANKNLRKLVFFGSKVPNKNFEFMIKVLKKYDGKLNVTVINPPEDIPGFNCVYTETNTQTLKVLSENDIYFHASDYETVGLPLYEAQNLGLKLVVPQKPYTEYFKENNVFIYEHKNVKSALEKIESANNFKIKNTKALIYKENWSKILEYL
jgi:hypothetical protein